MYSVTPRPSRAAIMTMAIGTIGIVSLVCGMALVVLAAAAGTFAGAHTGTPPQGTEIPLLRPEILSGFFHHLANGQVVGAARLAGAATYAGAGLFVQRGVALAPPLLQAVPI